MEVQVPTPTGMETVMEFLKKNGLVEVELALKEDMMERKRELSRFDFETFLFPMVPPPPPVKIFSSNSRRSNGLELDGRDCLRSDEDDEEEEEFVSLDSSSSIVCSSEFTNPYGVELRSATGVGSEASSDELSAFGTARDYHEFDMQDEHYLNDEKDGGCFMTPCFNGLEEPFGCEDKFVMTSETTKQCANPFGVGRELDQIQLASIDYLHKPSTLNTDCVNKVQLADYYHLAESMQPEKVIQGKSESYRPYDFDPLCKCCAGAGGVYARDPVDHGDLNLKEHEMNDIQFKVVGEIPTDTCADFEQKTNMKLNVPTKNGLINTSIAELSDLHIQASLKDLQLNGKDGYEVGENADIVGKSHEEVTAEKDDATVDELLMFDTHEEEYEVFNLRIIHRKNRTGFEEHKDFPIILNTIIAGRYYVTEYLGSAAFSKVVQAQDLLTGIDVCLKIIKNDKDFFDQSLDEIKLLKLVNKQDPADEHHILRLYDYFYHQEHLFIVCELLRANLYEFQKFNQESGGEPYFTLRRLQVITRQCLEALEFLHQMGIIHCDLKPENILIKSYRRCEIKIIDLGSSCFLADNLSLYVQSRSYRAPEVILGLPYDQKIDMWSLGCILVELCSGEVLFPNETLAMLLGRVIGMLGPIGMEMLERGQETNKYFTEEYDLYYINKESNQLEYVIPEESSLEHHLHVSDVGFIDFVTCLLEINPWRRPTAREALQHPWLSHQYDT